MVPAINFLIDFWHAFSVAPQWEVVASIATATMVIYTYKTLRQYKQREERIEKREILERVIQPLADELEFINDLYISAGSIGSFDWVQLKRQNPHLVLRMNLMVKQKLEEFNRDHEELRFVLREFRLKLIDLFQNRVLDYLKRQTTSESARTLQEIATNSKEFIESWRVVVWKVGAREFSIQLFRPIFSGSTLRALVENSQHSSLTLSREIIDAKYTLLYAPTNENDLEEIVSLVREDIYRDENNIKQLKYIQTTFQKAQNLLELIEQFKSRDGL